MSRATDRLHIVTGGPGAGKTTLVDALAATGVAIVPEVGRAVVREELAAGRDALPWGDERAFAERMWPREVAAHADALRLDTTVILDRGVPDVVGFLRAAGLPVPAHLDAAVRAHRYNVRVFLAPFWAEIYTHDPERRQPPELAHAAEAAMRRTYVGYGYLPIELPRVSVGERVAFVLEHLAG